MGHDLLTGSAVLACDSLGLLTEMISPYLTAENYSLYEVTNFVMGGANVSLREVTLLLGLLSEVKDHTDTLPALQKCTSIDLFPE